jgi:uncharacterized protein
MNLLITGSSGFIGCNLIRYFIDAGHHVTGIDAVTNPKIEKSPLVNMITADTTQTGNWQESVKNANVVINLTGKNIFSRWDDRYKKLMYNSRIMTTRHLVDALSDDRHTVFISASAVGYYGNQGDVILDENASSGDDFLARLCVGWEAEALRATEKGVRTIFSRFGVVLGKNGGALSKMATPFRLFIGGPLGDGQQWFSWIHIKDLINAMRYVIEHPEIEGPLNFCSPHPVRNNDFSKALAKQLNRPSFFRIPALMLRLAAGELGDMALYSQRGYPDKLLSFGYQFKYPTIGEALSVCLN